MEIKLDFNKSMLNKWESFFGCPYSNWTEEQKSEFLTSLVINQVSTLDQYVESLSIANPFEDRISMLENMNFEVVYRGEFVYPYTGIPGQDVVMFNKETGMLYYTTSYQDAHSINRTTDVKHSYLYFQTSGMKDGASKEAEQLLKASSYIRYADGSSYHSYSKISPEEISLLLNNCEFVSAWSQNPGFSILNEGDCFNIVGNQLEDAAIQEAQDKKIMQMPEYVQEIISFQSSKKM